MRTIICTFLIWLVLLVPALAQSEYVIKQAIANSGVLVSIFGEEGFQGTATHVENGFWLSVSHLIIKDGELPDSITINDMEAEVVDYGLYPLFGLMVMDWALLKSEPAGFTPLNYEFETGDRIFRVGNDLGRGLAVCDGYVGAEQFWGEWTTLMPSHMGMSGGGVYNTTGGLIGISTALPVGSTSMVIFIPITEGMFDGME